MLRALETDQPYKIHMAHVASSNPVGAAISSCPQRWYEALKRLDFNVVTDLFMTPTAMAVCDVFLPLASCVEHNDVENGSYMLASMRRTETSRPTLKESLPFPSVSPSQALGRRVERRSPLVAAGPAC